jgi:hypothetical protein
MTTRQYDQIMSHLWALLDVAPMSAYAAIRALMWEIDGVYVRG